MSNTHTRRLFNVRNDCSKRLESSYVGRPEQCARYFVQWKMTTGTTTLLALYNQRIPEMNSTRFYFILFVPSISIVRKPHFVDFLIGSIWTDCTATRYTRTPNARVRPVSTLFCLTTAALEIHKWCNYNYLYYGCCDGDGDGLMEPPPPLHFGRNAKILKLIKFNSISTHKRTGGTRWKWVQLEMRNRQRSNGSALQSTRNFEMEFVNRDVLWHSRKVTRSVFRFLFSAVERDRTMRARETWTQNAHTKLIHNREIYPCTPYMLCCAVLFIQLER